VGMCAVHTERALHGISQAMIPSSERDDRQGRMHDAVTNSLTILV